MGELRLQQALFDLNGTLALDGIIPETFRERLVRLQETLTLYVVTADTHGTAADLTRDCGDLKIAQVQTGNQAGQKHALFEDLEAASTVTFGNGANDGRMLRKARLGIGVMQGEGTSLQALLASDFLVPRAEEGVDLRLHPTRLTATLRS